MKLAPEHRDALTELVHIGVGRAAAALNEILSSHVELSVPRLEVMNRQELKTAAFEFGGGRLSSVHLGFRGGMTGEAALIFPDESARRVVELLTGETSPEQVEAFRAGTLQEVGNIVVNGVVGTISNMLREKLEFSIPDLREGDLMQLFQGEADDVAVVVVHTRFRIRGRPIEGNILLVFEVESFSFLLSRLEDLSGDRS